MKKILLSAPYMLMEAEKFDAFFAEKDLDVTYANIKEHLSEAELLEIIPEYDGAICGDDPYTRKVFEKAKRLKVVSKWGTGINTIDLQAAREHGVKICNTPNAFSHPVSDTAVAYMLTFARNVMESTTQMKNGIWKKIPCFTLGEKTLGIIGLGNIGTQTARRASAFGMKIIANDVRDITPIICEQYNIKMVSKDEIYEKADFITIHADLNEDTYHLLNHKTFAKMVRKPYIINTARGGHIDQSALLYALENGQISGAGLDVYENEPIFRNDKLLSFDNVLLSPHNSNSSPKYWEKVHRNTLKNLVENL